MEKSAGDQEKLLAAALRRLEVLRRREAFDPISPESKPTEKQQAVFDDFSKIKQQWIRAGNQSGKSQTCARILTWVITETHPSWKRPTTWGEEPLLAIVCGRTGKQIEDSLLPKLRSYLEPGTFKEVRIGNIIQRIELENGNRIIFQSLENPNVARERLMSYVAHITWCDELPPSLELVRELLVRTQARDGYSLWSFTPTIVAADIQRYVDALKEPEGKVYRFHMLDNPLYSNEERKLQLLSRYAHLPEDQQKAIFEGEWLTGENQVYYFNWDTMVEIPPDYSRLWRHVEVVDPALSSALGLTIWAECPTSGVWYCVKAEYITGIYIPTAVVEAVRNITKDYNIVRRISDPHEVWYIQQAAAAGINYMGVHKKNERKGELIKGLQQSLGAKVRISPTCTHLIDELQTCRWSDRAEGKIINASSYHLLDTAQYFCDSIPKQENKITASSHQEWLYKANEQRKIKEDKKKQQLEKRIQIRRRQRWN